MLNELGFHKYASGLKMGLQALEKGTAAFKANAGNSFTGARNVAQYKHLDMLRNSDKLRATPFSFEQVGHASANALSEHAGVPYSAAEQLITSRTAGPNAPRYMRGINSPKHVARVQASNQRGRILRGEAGGAMPSSVPRQTAGEQWQNRLKRFNF
jgi:hypothetical protein